MPSIDVFVAKLVGSHWFILLGTMLAVFGIWQTWRQARGAKSAADSAKQSAEAAMKRIVGFDASVSLFTAVEAIYGLTESVRKNELDDAIQRCQEVRKIIQRFLSSGASSDAVVTEKVGALADYLRVLTSEILAAQAGAQLDTSKAQIILYEHAVVLSGVCETLRQFEVSA